MKIFYSKIDAFLSHHFLEQNSQEYRYLGIEELRELPSNGRHSPHTILYRGIVLF